MAEQTSGAGEHRRSGNVGGRERLLSMMLGGGLIALAMTRKRFAPRLLALPGLLLLLRGKTGHSLLYTMFDVTTSRRRATGPEEAAGRATEGAAAESPHPRIPGTHEHPVPPNELGVPSADVTPKLMREIAIPVVGEEEPESGE